MELSEVYISISQPPNIGVSITKVLPLGVFAPANVTGYNATVPKSNSLNGNMPMPCSTIKLM